MSDPDFVIIGQSGRSLAASAFRAGVRCYVIDLFADLDTRQYAIEAHQINELSTGLVRQALKQIPLTAATAKIITGSGFEDKPEIIDYLQANWFMIGNSSDVIRQVKDPLPFYGMLDQLGIQHPATQLTVPHATEKAKWLIKKKGGAGGEHIHYYSAELSYGSDEYFQEYQPGENYSTVFLADGKQGKIIGYNKTWTENTTSFRFGGAVSLVQFPDALSKQVDSIVTTLVSSFGLVGLCGMDFIVHDDKIYVLEINPRPTATFDLHENDQQNLFISHIRACRGELNTNYADSSVVCAKAIVYAEKDLHINIHDWPAWVADIPCYGQVIQKHNAVCTVYASAQDADSTVKIVHNRLQQITRLCEQRA